MGLETATYIGQLVSTNPTGTDAKGQGDDHFRLIKATLKETFAGFTSGAVLVTGTDTGSANTYVLTPTPALAGYVAGMSVIFLPITANTGASTINISGLGAKDLKSVSGADLINGELQVDYPVVARYDGLAFRLTGITKQYADQLAFGGSLPGQTANGGKVLGTDGAVASWVWAGLNGRRAVVGADTIIASDKEKLLACSGTFSLALTAAATLGSQFGTYVVNNGAGLITLDPNGSELIDGQATKAIPPNCWCLVFGDATGFYTISNIPNVTRSARTSNSILTGADRGTYIDVTANTFTQTVTAAATLGNGWFVDYGNSGSGVVTIDPNGSETIGGIATLAVNSGEVYRVQSDASNFNVICIQADAGPHVIVQEQAPSGNGPQNSPTSLAFVTRDLNTMVRNTKGASLVSNEVTLPGPATWRLEARAPGQAVDQHRIKITNVTAGTVAVLGSSMLAQNLSNGTVSVMNDSVAVGVVTISAATAFKIEHFTGGSQLSRTFGQPVNSGDIEIYAEFRATRISG